MRHQKYADRPELLDIDIAQTLRHVKEALRHPKPLNSPHEGYAFIKEALDKLWATVTATSYLPNDLSKNAIVLTAQAVRYAADVAPIGGPVGVHQFHQTVDAVIESVAAEVKKAMTKHKAMVSAHEAYGVIREEVDELWDEVKPDRGRTEDAHKEAIQIAAMGVRYILDVVGLR